MSVLASLFLSFCQIGFSSFGGVTMFPLINSEMTSHGWMTSEEVMDIIAIAEMTPGPMGLNCATFAGMRVAGVLGAIVATLGVLMPTFTIGTAAVLFFEKFKDSATLKKIMFGVRPVCLGLICAVILDLSQSNYLVDGAVSWVALMIGAIAAFMAIHLKWNVPRVILISAALGLLFVR